MKQDNLELTIYNITFTLTPSELHHYHPVGCGGIVSVASTVCGGVLSYLAIAASLVAVIFQVNVGGILDILWEVS